LKLGDGGAHVAAWNRHGQRDSGARKIFRFSNENADFLVLKYGAHIRHRGAMRELVFPRASFVVDTGRTNCTTSLKNDQD
jgi:hypothetical protein